jgi:hypothetical protein
VEHLAGANEIRNWCIVAAFAQVLTGMVQSLRGNQAKPS